MAEWQLLLLAGSTAAGKSTSGTEVARRLGIACVSADSVWKALERATTPETHPAFRYFEPPPDVMARGPDHLLKLHIEAAEAMTGALDAFIDWELHEGHRFVFEGAWITPEFAAGRCASERERAIFIDEPVEQEILGSMLQRSKRTEPLPRQFDDLRDDLAVWELAPRANDEARPAQRTGAAEADIGRPYHSRGRIGDFT